MAAACWTAVATTHDWSRAQGALDELRMRARGAEGGGGGVGHGFDVEDEVDVENAAADDDADGAPLLRRGRARAPAEAGGLAPEIAAALRELGWRRDGAGWSALHHAVWAAAPVTVVRALLELFDELDDLGHEIAHDESASASGGRGGDRARGPAPGPQAQAHATATAMALALAPAADVGLASTLGRTALHMAAACHAPSADVVRALLERAPAAVIDAKTLDGSSALDLARRNRSCPREVVDLLAEAAQHGGLVDESGALVSSQRWRRGRPHSAGKGRAPTTTTTTTAAAAAVAAVATGGWWQLWCRCCDVE